MSDLEIVWTKVDEAPALATFSLLPIVQAFVGTAGVKMKLKDISLTGRIIANGFARAQTREFVHVVPNVSALMAALSEAPAISRKTDIDQL